MPRTDRFVAIFFLLFSGYVCWKSLQLGLGAFHKPGPGFISFWSGLFVGILASLMIIQSIRLKKANLAEEKKEKTNWKAIFTVFASFFSYILLLNYLGFTIMTTLFVGTLLKVIEKKRWILTIWVSLVIALGSYAVFKVWLQAELPEGIFGF